MTDDELHEIAVMIDALDIKPWQKRLALARCISKCWLRGLDDRKTELTSSALAILGKMKMPV